LNPLEHYGPATFIEDIERFLMAVAYDRRLQRVQAFDQDKVRDARRPSHGREA
jgi:hypothetical protein